MSGISHAHASSHFRRFYTLNALLNGVARSGLRPVSESRESHLWNASYLPPELASVFATPSFLALFPLVLGVGRVSYYSSYLAFRDVVLPVLVCSP